MSATFSDSPDSARLDTDLHVRLREARERFDTPAIMARSLSIRLWAYTQRHGLTATDRESLIALRDDLDTLGYWCASVGVR